jgi:hypothetical protein
MGQSEEETALRDDLILQLKESLAMSRQMMNNEKLDAKTRGQLAQLTPTPPRF